MDDLSQQEFQNHIGGEWVPCASGATAPNLNPADTTDVVGRFPLSDATDGARAVAAAQAAFAAWRDTPISKRAAILFRAAQYLEDHADSVARELTREEGKGLALARDEVLRSAQTASTRWKGSRSPARPSSTMIRTWWSTASASRWAW